MSDAQYNELKQLITTGNAAVHSLRGERTNAHVKEMEEFAAVKAELAAIRRTLQGVPLESVQAFLAYEVQGFSVAWWLRQGLVLDKDHRQYPSDPGSQADLIQQIFEKVTGKQLVPYDGTQKRPRNSIPFGGDQSEKEES